MQNHKSEELFSLIKGMNKWEKKSFHLYAKRNFTTDQLKVLAVYRALNSMEQYDEQKLAGKLKNTNIRQLPNLKVSLYKLLLDSLRLYPKEETVELQLHQLMDHAKILYDRGFIGPALKTLKRLKLLALNYHQVSFAFQGVVMVKKIELVHGNCEEEKIQNLNREMQHYNQQLSMIAQFSNVSMLLYGWHKKFGVAKKEDREQVQKIFEPCLNYNESMPSFYPQLYWLQASTYFYLVMNDSELFFKHAKGWVDLFSRYPGMEEIEKIQYFRGLAYLTEASLKRKDTVTMKYTVDKFQTTTDVFYFFLARLNSCILENELDSSLLTETKALLQKMKNPERIIVLCYKAMLCASNRINTIWLWILLMLPWLKNRYPGWICNIIFGYSISKHTKRSVTTNW